MAKKKARGPGRPKVHKELEQITTLVTPSQLKRLRRMTHRLQEQSGRSALGRAALIRAALDAVMTRCSKLKFDAVENEKTLTEAIIREMATPLPRKKKPRRQSTEPWPDDDRMMGPWGDDFPA